MVSKTKSNKCINCEYNSLEYAKYIKAWVYTCNYKGKGCYRGKPIEPRGVKGKKGE